MSAEQTRKIPRRIRHAPAFWAWYEDGRHFTPAVLLAGNCRDRETPARWRDKEGWVEFADLLDADEVEAKLAAKHKQERLLEEARINHLEDMVTILKGQRTVLGMETRELLVRQTAGGQIDAGEFRDHTAADPNIIKLANHLGIGWEQPTNVNVKGEGITPAPGAEFIEAARLAFEKLGIEIQEEEQP